LEKLKNEPNFVAAKLSEPCVAETGCVLVREDDLTGGGEIHGSAQIEQSGFAAAAATEKCGHLSRRAIERDTAQGFHTAGVDFRHIANGDWDQIHPFADLQNEANVKLTGLLTTA
jgi:hypothetical protein